MNRRLSLVLLLVPSLTGCTPDGPKEFYRAALQARSEFVDALSRVVDDQTAKEKFDKAEKLLTERLGEIKAGLDKNRYEGGFSKLGRSNFTLKMIDEDDRQGMIAGLKAYAEYCKNICYTNVRFSREKKRMKMVMNMVLLEKARSQAQSNQPIEVNPDRDAPNLNKMFEKLDKMNEINLRYVREGMAKETLKNLESGIDDNLLSLVLEFKTDDLDAKFPGVEPPQPPALPAYPAWALELDRKANLGLTAR